MALLKKKTTKEGIAVAYWKITGYEFDILSKKGRITVSPYVSKKVRDNGGVPISSERTAYRVEDIEYGEESTRPSILHYTEHFSPPAIAEKTIYTAMYEYLKKHIQFFADAEDA